jgi:hypothetical protein
MEARGMSVMIDSSINMPTIQDVVLNEDTLVTLASGVDQLRVVSALGFVPELCGIVGGFANYTLVLVNATANQIGVGPGAIVIPSTAQIMNSGTLGAGMAAILWYDGENLGWRVLTRGGS